MLINSSGKMLSSYDDSVRDFILRFRAGGDNPTELEMNALNFWVRSYKQYNLWSKVYAHFPFVGGSGDAQSVENFTHNLKSSSYKLTTGNLGTAPIVGASCTATGLYRFGNLSFFETGYTANHGNNMALSVYSRTHIAQGSNHVSIGATNKPAYDTFKEIDLSGGYFIIGDLTGLTSVSLADTRGFFTVSRTSSTLLKAYRNGKVIHTDTHTNVSDNTTESVGILGRPETIGYGYPDDHELACATISQGWTEAEEAIRARIQLSFERMLGRAIEP